MATMGHLIESDEAFTAMIQAAESSEIVVSALREVLSVAQLEKLNLFVGLNSERIDDALQQSLFETEALGT